MEFTFSSNMRSENLGHGVAKVLKTNRDKLAFDGLQEPQSRRPIARGMPFVSPYDGVLS